MHGKDPGHGDGNAHQVKGPDHLAQKGCRDEKEAKPLVGVDELPLGLRADQIIGAEVRSSDDKIVGEVRNIVFGTKDSRD